jgi:hypothetical protein
MTDVFEPKNISKSPLHPVDILATNPRQDSFKEKKYLLLLLCYGVDEINYSSAHLRYN